MGSSACVQCARRIVFTDSGVDNIDVFLRTSTGGKRTLSLDPYRWMNPWCIRAYRVSIRASTHSYRIRRYRHISSRTRYSVAAGLWLGRFPARSGLLMSRSVKGVGGPDQGQMGESLRVVTCHAVGGGVVFLTQQTKVVPAPNEPVHERLCFGNPA